MRTVKLNNGVKMPIMGFGVYQMNPKDCERSVLEALEIGYRLLDTAAVYGNEREVGKAVKQSGIKREEIFITTKLWIQDCGYKTALKAFEKSLKNLNTDYIDLYLIHQPFGDVYASWKVMEKLYKDGKVRAIGLSNFQSDRLVDLILHNEICPAVNQVETNPFCQQISAQKLMKKYKVQIESWAPFAEGRNGFFENPTLTELANKYGKSPAQVTLRWLIQRSVVAIPKSVRRERIAENFDVFNFKLEDSDMAKIASLDRAKSCFFDHRDPEIVKWISGIKI